MVAALTGKPGENLAICMMVEQLAPETHTILRTERFPLDEFDPFVDEVMNLMRG